MLVLLGVVVAGGAIVGIVGIGDIVYCCCRH